MKIYMMTDLEGVAGVVTFYSQTSPGGTYYEAARRLLTAEVNAAVDGLLAADVDEVLVCDGHGPGGIVFEELHPEAMLLHGRPLAPRSTRDAIVADFDACVMIGQHAMAGTPAANMNHTQNSRTVDHYRLNGKPIGEIAQFALYMGALGLPMLFLSGDEEACREARELVPDVATAAVKHSLSRNSAISLSAARSREMIRSGIAAAVETHRQTPVAPLEWAGPYTLEKRFFHTDDADAAQRHLLAERVDGQTVRYKSDTITDVLYA